MCPLIPRQRKSEKTAFFRWGRILTPPRNARFIRQRLPKPNALPDKSGVPAGGFFSLGGAGVKMRPSAAANLDNLGIPNLKPSFGFHSGFGLRISEFAVGPLCL
jgi:hypothetical protein